jgi:hypothetical protein
LLSPEVITSPHFCCLLLMISLAITTIDVILILMLCPLCWGCHQQQGYTKPFQPVGSPACNCPDVWNSFLVFTLALQVLIQSGGLLWLQWCILWSLRRWAPLSTVWETGTWRNPWGNPSEDISSLMIFYCFGLLFL